MVFANAEDSNACIAGTYIHINKVNQSPRPLSSLVILR